MDPYFEIESYQIEPRHLVSFGIRVESRYGKTVEIVQMLNFTRELAQADAHRYVKSVFYDSKACVCTFEINPEVRESDPVGKKIMGAAKASISQFKLFGGIDYGFCVDAADEVQPQVRH